jgi:xanthine dehydrogenase large subunit
MNSAGKAIPHESAAGHVSGTALYTDDLCLRYPKLLHAWPVMAPHAYAMLLRLSTAAAMEIKGVCTVLTAADVPGENDTGSNRHDEPLFPEEVMFHQQPVAWVLGETLDAARAGAAAVRAEYEALPAIVTIHQAIDARSFLAEPLSISHGNVSVMELSPLRFEGELEIGGQEHSISRRNARSRAWTNRVESLSSRRRSIRRRLRILWRACSVFHGIR